MVNVSGAVVFRFEKLNDNWLRFGREKEKPTWWQVGHFLHNHLNLVQQLAGSIQGLGHLVANSMRKKYLVGSILTIDSKSSPTFVNSRKVFQGSVSLRRFSSDA